MTTGNGPVSKRTPAEVAWRTVRSLGTLPARQVPARRRNPVARRRLRLLALSGRPGVVTVSSASNARAVRNGHVAATRLSPRPRHPSGNRIAATVGTRRSSRQLSAGAWKSVGPSQHIECSKPWIGPPRPHVTPAAEGGTSRWSSLANLAFPRVPNLPSEPRSASSAPSNPEDRLIWRIGQSGG